MTDALFSVEGQVVLVAGASRGIGRAIAKGFVDRGATVIITGRERETLEKTAGELSAADGSVSGKESRPAVRPLVCDMAKPDDIRKLTDDVMAEFGHVDTLINVAGVNRRKRAEVCSEDDYDFILDINLKGPFLLSQAVGKHMLARGKGNQINIASLNNDRPLKGVMLYAMSKAGLGHMTRSLALEWGDRGIRVNAIAPGFIVTDLSRKLWSEPHMQAWNLANTPQRRLGMPEDMVGTAVFLASQASAFMTGQVLLVDGGFSAGLAWPIEL